MSQEREVDDDQLEVNIKWYPIFWYFLPRTETWWGVVVVAPLDDYEISVGVS
jgi:hypothetical protein